MTLNQVLVSFGDDARTDDVVQAAQKDGTCWVGATTWRRPAADAHLGLRPRHDRG
ncbi:hypothetical protein WKI71_00360 [Streptomyces sp. MS1.AVA.1]|uniref:Uncharacterized protein n=1 Tax=Streptomyces machairae TaxID=3134109 RepID=A0ABU8UF77_9ACTN